MTLNLPSSPVVTVATVRDPETTSTTAPGAGEGRQVAVAGSFGQLGVRWTTPPIDTRAVLPPPGEPDPEADWLGRAR